jgi:hypothetical protein
MSSADAHLALLEAVRAFFEAERVWAVSRLSCGGVLCLAALACWLGIARPFAVGLAVPFALSGLLEGVLGAREVFEAPREADVMTAWVREAPDLVATSALPRFQARVEAYRASRWADGALFALGLVLLSRPGVRRGAGTGLLLVALITWAFDAQALSRAAAYVDQLERFVAVVS